MTRDAVTRALTDAFEVIEKDAQHRADQVAGGPTGNQWIKCWRTYMAEGIADALARAGLSEAGGDEWLLAMSTSWCS